MRERIVFGLGALAILGLLIAGCTWFGVQSLESKSLVGGDDYIVSFTRLPSNAEARMSSIGGVVTEVLEEIGVLLVRGDRAFAEQAAGIPGVCAVIPDLSFELAPPAAILELDPEVVTPEDEYYYQQWGLDAVNAPEAWEAGFTGQGVRVAILDTGIDVDDPDLEPNIDFESSASMVDWPDEEDIDDCHGHGSHVAGIVAAASGGGMVIGIAPNATIIAVRVFAEQGGEIVGYFSWTLKGILHAVSEGADIINMSLGAYEAHWNAPAAETNEFLNLLRSTINYAVQEGVFVTCSAGNDSWDGTGDQGILHIPSDIGNGVCVSATAPVGWTPDSGVDLDGFASYSNYGSSVDFSAPGGDYQMYPEPNWWLDMVLSCWDGDVYMFAAGTSQAAPHVAGVAALILEAYGDIKPAQMKAILRHSADELGRPGWDPYYGHGRVNAARAVVP
jgi:subtilisin family serine protease